MLRMFCAGITGMVICSTGQAAIGWNDKVSREHIASVASNTPPAPLPEGKANQIIVYSADWCSSCQRLKPVLLSLKTAGYQVVDRDVDKDGDNLEYSFVVLPTIYFMRGDAIIKRKRDFAPRSTFNGRSYVKPIASRANQREDGNKTALDRPSGDDRFRWGGADPGRLASVACCLTATTF